MKGHLQKGEIGTIIAISALIIMGVSSLVSSVFLSQKQTTSSKATSVCRIVFKAEDCNPKEEVKGGTCSTADKKLGTAECFECCSKPKSNSQNTIQGNIPAPTNKPISTVVPTKSTSQVSGTIPTAVKDECTDGQTSNQGCGVYTCATDRSRQCKCINDKNTGSLKWSCLCVPDASCITPTPTLAPTAVPANTGLGAGSENQTGAGGSLASCPDGGILHTSGFAAGACDYGRQSAGNSVYIDKDNPDDCAKCVWVKYDGSFPYGQCYYANNSVCRRGDNVGGCAGVCNAACCSDNSRKENGDVYDQRNIPGSSGLVSSDIWPGSADESGGGSVVDTGAGGDEFTVAEDMSFSGIPKCGDDGRSYILYPDGFHLDLGPC